MQIGQVIGENDHIQCRRLSFCVSELFELFLAVEEKLREKMGKSGKSQEKAAKKNKDRIFSKISVKNVAFF